MWHILTKLCNEKNNPASFPSPVPGLDIVQDGITIVRDLKGRNSGEAFVRFASQDMADEALQRDRGHIGSR